MQVLKASWEITRSCNADCAHCYVDGSHDLGQLDDKSIDKLLTNLYNGGVRFLTLTGGEPTVSCNFSYILLKAIELGFYCKVITNGTVYNQSLISANLSGKLEVIVSILAGKPQDFSKAYRLPSKLFYKQKKMLENLKSFSANVSLFSDNSTENVVNGIADYLSNYSNSLVDVSVFGVTKNGRGMQNRRQFNLFDLNAATRILIGRLAQLGIIADHNVDCADSDACPLIGMDVPSEIFINPKGFIRPCHALVFYETSRSLVNTELSDLVYSREIIRWRSDPRFVFDRRCKASLLQSYIDNNYVENSGGINGLIECYIECAPDIVVEKHNTNWVIYRKSSYNHLEINDDAKSLLDKCLDNSIKSFIESLDEDEIEVCLSVLQDFEIASLISIVRPAMKSGGLSPSDLTPQLIQATQISL